MSGFLKHWLGLTKKVVTEEERLATRYERLADMPVGEMLQRKTVAVCLGKQFVLSIEESLPKRLTEGETCWVVPADEVVLPVHVAMNDASVEANVWLRFEMDNTFANFTDGRDHVTKNEIVSLVVEHWTELVETERTTAMQLLSDDINVLSRFRSHLSLLMQEHGFRCTGIDHIAKTEASTVETRKLSSPDEVCDEAVIPIDNETEWKIFLDPSLDRSEEEFPAKNSLPDEKNCLPDKTTQKIRGMIEQKDLEIAAIARKIVPWNVTALLSRFTKSSGNTESSGNDGKGPFLKTAKNLPKKNRAPNTWYMLRKYKIDEKLRKYLHDSVDELEQLLESTKKRQTQLLLKSKLAKSQAVLRRLRLHLDTMPTLIPRLKTLRRSLRDPGELLAMIRRGVASVRLAAGLLHKLAVEDYSEADYENTVQELEHVLDRLENEILTRKKVYNH